MNYFKEKIKNLLIKKSVIEILISLTITALIIYTFLNFIINPTVHIDDTMGKFFLEKGGYYTQGRLGAVVYYYLFFYFLPKQFYPFFGLIFFFITSHFIASFINKYFVSTYFYFLMFLVTFPIITEIIHYDFTFFINSFASMILVVSFLFINKSNGHKSFSSIVFVILISLSVTVYESLILLYLALSFFVVYFDNFSFKTIIKQISLLTEVLTFFLLIYLIPVILPNDVINFAAGFNFSDNLLNYIYETIIKSLFFYGFNSFFNYYVLIYFLAFLYLIVYLFFSRKLILLKKISIFFLYSSPLFIGILTNQQAYRTSLTMSVVIPFALYIMFKEYKLFFKTILISLTVINSLVFNNLISLSIDRNSEERIVLEFIHQKLENPDSLPVTFLGQYKFSDNLSERIYVKNDNFFISIFSPITGSFLDLDRLYLFSPFQTQFNSVINWGSNLYISKTDSSQLHYVALEFDVLFPFDNEFINDQAKELVLNDNELFQFTEYFVIVKLNNLHHYYNKY